MNTVHEIYFNVNTTSSFPMLLKINGLLNDKNYRTSGDTVKEWNCIKRVIQCIHEIC